jgi:hypothetical protein
MLNSFRNGAVGFIGWLVDLAFSRTRRDRLFVTMESSRDFSRAVVRSAPSLGATKYAGQGHIAHKWLAV